MEKQPKRKISAKAIRADIRSKTNDEALKEKYGFSEIELRVVLQKLLAAGVVTKAELDARTPRRRDEQTGREEKIAVPAHLSREPAAERSNAQKSDSEPESTGKIPPAETVSTERPDGPIHKNSQIDPLAEGEGASGSSASTNAEPITNQRTSRRVSKAVIGLAAVVCALGIAAAAFYLSAPDLIPGLMLASTTDRHMIPAPVKDRQKCTPVKRGAAPQPKPQSDVGQLPEAAEKGDVNRVRAILESGVDVNHRYEKGMTPLMVAAKKGRTDVAKLLLDKGADVNAKSKIHMTALMVAAAGGHKNTVDLLIGKGADLNVKDSVTGMSALTRAMKGRHAELVKRLLEHGSKFNPQGKDELDYLASVAEAGHLDLAKLLLDKGLDLSARGSFKNTPLLAAACKGQVDLVRLFLDKGADVNVGGFGNETALTCAFKNHHTEIMNLLISRGADVNVKRSGGDTMLITAVSRGDDPSVTELLLKAGADVHVSDFAGRAALDIACDKNALKVIEVLAKHGANLNRKNPKDGGTALMFAAANGRVEAVKLLLQLGADPNVIDDRGLTALKYATIWKKEPIVDLLKDRAAK